MTAKVLGKLIRGWKVNALRHSYVSYRYSQVGAAKTALEVGNSGSVTREHYLDLMREKLLVQLVPKVRSFEEPSVKSLKRMADREGFEPSIHKAPFKEILRRP